MSLNLKILIKLSIATIICVLILFLLNIVDNYISNALYRAIFWLTIFFLILGIYGFLYKGQKVMLSFSIINKNNKEQKFNITIFIIIFISITAKITYLALNFIWNLFS